MCAVILLQEEEEVSFMDSSRSKSRMQSHLGSLLIDRLQLLDPEFTLVSWCKQCIQYMYLIMVSHGLQERSSHVKLVDLGQRVQVSTISVWSFIAVLTGVFNTC